MQRRPQTPYHSGTPTEGTDEKVDEQADEFYQALDDLLDQAKEVGDDYADVRTPEIARELAKARKSITRAKAHRVDDLAGVQS